MSTLQIKQYKSVLLPVKWTDTTVKIIRFFASSTTLTHAVYLLNKVSVTNVKVSHVDVNGCTIG